MPAPKRARACDACHSIKIKCELGSIGGEGPCSRCVRLDKECVITPPKRQKDRVAELEAQVAALTRLLEAQNINGADLNGAGGEDGDDPTPVDSLSPESRGDVDGKTTVSSTSRQKKRRLDHDQDQLDGHDSNALDSPILEIDRVVSMDLQKQVLRKYVDQMVPVTPLVPITSEWNYEDLRAKKPLLLQAIIYAASPGLLSNQCQEDITNIVIDIFAKMAIAEGKKSVQLIQAIQIAVMWYRTPKHHHHVAAFQLIQVAAGLAEDIGLGGSAGSPSLGFCDTSEDLIPADRWRTWLSCRLLSASLSVFMRRASVQRWTEHDEHSLFFMEYSEHAISSDRLLSQFVRAEKLCENIASQLNFCDFSSHVDLADPVVTMTMQSLQNQITDWKAQISPSIDCPSLKFWEHAATMYLHEIVLHTGTNKQSFAAPYLAERLSVTDFPTPFVSTEHVTSIHTLKSAAHALIDLFVNMEMEMLMGLSTLLFVARIAYAAYILMKIYIATTGPGNTFGAFLDPESVKIEAYLDKILEVAEKARQFDQKCGPARILIASARMKELLKNYKSSLRSQQFAVDNSDAFTGMAQVGDDFTASLDDFTFTDNTIDFGLDDIFATPLFMDDSFANLLHNNEVHEPSLVT